MKLPFSHKEEESRIPIEEVRKLREQGKSDREIIVVLKNKNYPFQVIEKAMLQVLKSGVGPEQKKASTNPAGNYPNQPYHQTQPPRPQPGQAGSQQESELPTREELLPRPNIPAIPGQEAPFESQFEPTDLIEEVVEGVVEEKFEKLDTKFEFIHKEQEKQKKDLEGIKNLFGSSIQKRDNTIEDLREDIGKLKEEIDALVIKSNALERAFKQFLPELTAKARKENLAEKGVEVIE